MTGKRFYDWQTSGGTNDVMRLVDCLERADGPWCAIGDLAVNHWTAQPVVTQDVDFVVVADAVDRTVGLRVVHKGETGTGQGRVRLLHLGFSPNVMGLDKPGIDEGMAWSAAIRARVPDRDATRIVGFEAKSFVQRGYGVAMAYSGDIYPDVDHGNAHGVPTRATMSAGCRLTATCCWR